MLREFEVIHTEIKEITYRQKVLAANQQDAVERAKTSEETFLCEVIDDKFIDAKNWGVAYV